jgi:hypothetical protein
LGFDDDKFRFLRKAGISNNDSSSKDGSFNKSFNIARDPPEVLSKRRMSKSNSPLKFQNNLN